MQSVRKILADRILSASFTVTLKIVRTVNNIKLPVSCYKMDGHPVGSCTFSSEKVCDYIHHWTAQQSNSYVWMTPIMKMLGLTVSCPTHVISEVPDVTTLFYNFLAPGTYNVTVKVDELNASSAEPFFCGVFTYALKPKK